MAGRRSSARGAGEAPFSRRRTVRRGALLRAQSTKARGVLQPRGGRGLGSKDRLAPGSGGGGSGPPRSTLRDAEQVRPRTSPATPPRQQLPRLGRQPQARAKPVGLLRGSGTRRRGPASSHRDGGRVLASRSDRHLPVVSRRLGAHLQRSAGRLRGRLHAAQQRRPGERPTAGGARRARPRPKGPRDRGAVRRSLAGARGHRGDVGCSGARRSAGLAHARSQ